MDRFQHRVFWISRAANLDEYSKHGTVMIVTLKYSWRTSKNYTLDVCYDPGLDLSNEILKFYLQLSLRFVLL